MSLESVRKFFAWHPDAAEILDLDRPSETGWLSAMLRLQPAQIAKTLTLRIADRHVLLIACADARLHNGKVKTSFNGKARLVPAEEAAELTGHVPGGICPFGLRSPLPVFCDVLLRRFDVVVTGGGAPCSAIRIGPLRMAELTGATWVDVCEG